MLLRVLKHTKALFCSSKPPSKYSDLQLQTLIQQPNPLLDVIKQELQNADGQIKLSKYWNLSLTHPQHGFYSQKNIFSTEGHFTTSPEVSSLFGEMLGVWIMHFVGSISKKYPDSRENFNGTLTLRPFRLIELGPGRGMLMADVLRCISQLKGMEFLTSLSMVEVSAENSQIQQKAVLDQLGKSDLHFGFEYNNPDAEIFKGENSKTQLRWFKSYFDLARSETFSQEEMSESQPLTIILAHEFFDALPTESLIFTQDGWKERVIKLNSDGKLVLVPSKHSLHEKFIPRVEAPELGATLEVSYESLMLMEQLAQTVSRTNGAIINIDYGNYFTHSDSIRAIREHKYVPYPEWLQLPGKVDLSSYVDFAALEQFASKSSDLKGQPPIPQGYFLEAMGINVRIDVLTKNKSTEIRERIERDYQRLVSPEEMGEIYKVQMVTRRDNEEVYPFLTGNNEGVF